MFLFIVEGLNDIPLAKHLIASLKLELSTFVNVLKITEVNLLESLLKKLKSNSESKYYNGFIVSDQGKQFLLFYYLKSMNALFSHKENSIIFIIRDSDFVEPANIYASFSNELISIVKNKKQSEFIEIEDKKEYMHLSRSISGKTYQHFLFFLFVNNSVERNIFKDINSRDPANDIECKKFIEEQATFEKKSFQEFVSYHIDHKKPRWFIDLVESMQKKLDIIKKIQKFN